MVSIVTSLAILAWLSSPASANVAVTFDPPGIHRPSISENGVKVGDDLNVTVMFQLQNTSNDVLIEIDKLECRDKNICRVTNTNHQNLTVILSSATEPLLNFTFNVRGEFLGKTTLDWDIEMDGKPPILPPFRINVLRSDLDTTLNTAFTGFIIVFITINTFMMGTQLHLSLIWGVLKKPIGPLIGFSCQYFMMPTLAFIFALLFIPDRPSLQFGYFAVGCSPGGGTSNFWTLLLNGNLDLSVTMTSFSTLAALFMMPFWLYTAGRVFYGGRLVLPVGNIVSSLFGLLIPAGFGLMLAHCRPNWVPSLNKLAKISTVVLLALLITMGSIVNRYVYQMMTWYTVVPGLCLPWFGYALSYVMARYVLRQSHKDAITIGIETGVQNGAIPIVICQLSLPPPDSDLTLVMQVAIMLLTGVPLWIALIYYKLKPCCVKKGEQIVDEQDKTDESEADQTAETAMTNEEKH